MTSPAAPPPSNDTTAHSNHPRSGRGWARCRAERGRSSEKADKATSISSISGPQSTAMRCNPYERGWSTRSSYKQQLLLHHHSAATVSSVAKKALGRSNAPRLAHQGPPPRSSRCASIAGKTDAPSFGQLAPTGHAPPGFRERPCARGWYPVRRSGCGRRTIRPPTPG
jgi:hypothetical protein